MKGKVGNVGKKITIERREKLAGSAIDYFVVLNLSEGEFLQSVGRKEEFSFGFKNTFLNESNQVFTIASGETITIDAEEEKNSFFIAAFPSPDRLFSQRIFVDEQDFDAKYAVSLKLGLYKNQFVIEKL